MSSFFRFPNTPHLAWLSGGAPRDDKVLSQQEAEDLLAGEVVLEEKVDGANLGISLNAEGHLQVQSRGHYLVEPYGGQFTRLPSWLAAHSADITDALFEHADQPLILFGEWCAARHSLDYTRLPDWFLVFDVVEAETSRFWSSNRRNVLVRQLGMSTTPELARGHFRLPELKSRLVDIQSCFRDGPLEGIVVRKETGNWCERRAKLVRPDFTQAISDHWRRRHIQWNRRAADATT